MDESVHPNSKDNTAEPANEAYARLGHDARKFTPDKDSAPGD
jgi:hypothetical protein